ncbi:hypothetical protein DFH09DRAFT_1454050 [Mycena vulgaris]|nr:hypothetical protein DFH09DRAFT_1454050 [Mycena vulgaris]
MEKAYERVSGSLTSRYVVFWRCNLPRLFPTLSDAWPAVLVVFIDSLRLFTDRAFQCACVPHVSLAYACDLEPSTPMSRRRKLLGSTLAEVLPRHRPGDGLWLEPMSPNEDTTMHNNALRLKLALARGGGYCGWRILRTRFRTPRTPSISGPASAFRTRGRGLRARAPLDAPQHNRGTGTDAGDDVAARAGVKGAIHVREPAQNAVRVAADYPAAHRLRAAISLRDKGAHCTSGSHEDGDASETRLPRLPSCSRGSMIPYGVQARVGHDWGMRARKRREGALCVDVKSSSSSSSARGMTMWHVPPVLGSSQCRRRAHLGAHLRVSHPRPSCHGMQHPSPPSRSIPNGASSRTRSRRPARRAPALDPMTWITMRLMRGTTAPRVPGASAESSSGRRVVIRQGCYIRLNSGCSGELRTFLIFARAGQGHRRARRERGVVVRVQGGDTGGLLHPSQFRVLGRTEDSPYLRPRRARSSACHRMGARPRTPAECLQVLLVRECVSRVGANDVGAGRGRMWWGHWDSFFTPVGFPYKGSQCAGSLCDAVGRNPARVTCLIRHIKKQPLRRGNTCAAGLYL